MVKGILDSLPLVEPQFCAAKPKCITIDCHGDVYIYCPICVTFYCSNCVCQHGVTSVFYNVYDGKIYAWCKLHMTRAKWFCGPVSPFNVSEFICVYCKHRQHKGDNHFPRTLESVGAEWRDTINTRILDDQVLRVKLASSLQQEEARFQLAKKVLMREVKHRKLLHIRKVMQDLNMEEEQIHTQFDDIVSKHRKQYSTANHTDDYTNVVAMEDTLFCAHIHDTLRKIFENTPKMKQTTLTLSDFLLERDEENSTSATPLIGAVSFTQIGLCHFLASMVP